MNKHLVVSRATELARQAIEPVHLLSSDFRRQIPPLAGLDLPAVDRADAFAAKGACRVDAEPLFQALDVEARVVARIEAHTAACARR